jgi:hypothetical protein
MELTKVQKDCIRALAQADVRPNDVMLGLILAEGIRFFFSDHDPIQSIKSAPGKNTSDVINNMVQQIEKEIQTNLN